jgi:hypothetical protein
MHDAGLTAGSSRLTQADAHSAADDAELGRWRSLSLRERGEQLRAACVLAAEIERSRLAMGLPKTQPAPWPQSTWEFLRRHAHHARG